ncbi:Rap1a/Tai family immunity protein [Pseudomonas antarctica]|nr:Rap1a/Tai family immunity protein [Pseudomonas antarctica]
MKTTNLTFALLGVLLSGNAWSATGNDLIQWGTNGPKGTTFMDGVYMGYISGVSDFSNGILYCAPPGVTNGQNVAVVTKFLKANPEKWTEQAASLIVQALTKAYPACKTK